MGGAPLNRNIALLADFPTSSSFSAPCCFLYVSVSWQLGPPQPSVAKNTAQSYAVSNSRPRANHWGGQTNPLKAHQCILAVPGEFFLGRKVSLAKAGTVSRKLWRTE